MTKKICGSIVSSIDETKEPITYTAEVPIQYSHGHYYILYPQAELRSIYYIVLKNYAIARAIGWQLMKGFPINTCYIRELGYPTTAKLYKILGKQSELPFLKPTKPPTEIKVGIEIVHLEPRLSYPHPFLNYSFRITNSSDYEISVKPYMILDGVKYWAVPPSKMPMTIPPHKYQTVSGQARVTWGTHKIRFGAEVYVPALNKKIVVETDEKTFSIAPPTPPEKPTVEIASLKVEPTKVYIGQDVVVTATLKGTPNSTWKVELYVNNSKVHEKTVVLDNRGSGIVRFTLKFKEAGRYSICVCCTNEQ